MSKKLYLVLFSFVFLGVNLNLNGMAADPDFEAEYELGSSEVMSQGDEFAYPRSFPRQQTGLARQAIASSYDPAQQTQVMVDKILKRMENLHKLNELLEEYNNDLTLVKNDPKFNEIKPALKEAYDMIASLPFLLSFARGGIDMFKAQVVENLAKKATIKGFELLNDDVEELMDNTFSYADKFIEFLKKFSKHFTENKVIQELLAD